MSGKKHDKKLPPEAFSGNTQEPFNQEAPHRNLARGALHKAAQQYQDGEIDAKEFHGHIARAHNRLKEPAMLMPAPTSAPVRVKSHRKKK